MGASVFAAGGMKVHEVAELFPMMSEEELEELALDIKANGLLNPIIRDEAGVLIDGRNRLEACRRAGIEPAYATLEGIDPVAFIMSSNDKRRHMTKGQRAMIAAKIVILNITTGREVAKASGKISEQYVSHAKVVLQYRPDLADEVIKGKPLNEAYEDALKEKAHKESDAGKLERLRRQAPDLLDQVFESTLSLAEAIAALDAREREEEQKRKLLLQQRQLSTRLLCETISSCDPYNLTVGEKSERFMALYEEKSSTEEITAERLARCGEVLQALAAQWSKKENGQKEAEESNV
jgi:ParB/Sulfiredoxin domain